jgi:hypothetical protein
MRISFLILSGLIPLSSLAAMSPRSPQVNPLKNMNGSMNLTTAEILAKDLAETPYLKLEADMTADDIVPAKKNSLFHNLNYDPNEGPSPFLRQNIKFSYSVDPSTGKIRFDDPDNRPKLLVLVQKNDPNPCDLDGALAQQKNPNLVFETMRLFNEFGEELKYPVINEVSTFESNDSSIVSWCVGHSLLRFSTDGDDFPFSWCDFRKGDQSRFIDEDSFSSGCNQSVRSSQINVNISSKSFIHEETKHIFYHLLSSR